MALSGSPNLTMDVTTASQLNKNITRLAGCDGGNTYEKRLHCLRNASVPSLIKAIPKTWMMPTQWDLPDDVQGKQYPGLAIVDGRVVAYPFFDALERAVIDVPFLFGNMAEEGDANIPTTPDINGMTDGEWKSFLDDFFLPFGDHAGDAIYNAYRMELEEGGPRRAFDAIVADISMTCGNLKAAKAVVKGSHFTSPLWLYNDAWKPSRPVWIDGVRSEYAFHMWDVLNGFACYKNLAPSDSDIAHGDFLRESWYELIATGEWVVGGGGSRSRRR